MGNKYIYLHIIWVDKKCVGKNLACLLHVIWVNKKCVGKNFLVVVSYRILTVSIWRGMAICCRNNSPFN